MFGTLAQAGRYLGQSMRLMVGLPEYDTYVAHMEKTHPGAADHELRGVLPRAPAGPLRQRQARRLLLSRIGASSHEGTPACVPFHALRFPTDSYGFPVN